jgi:hypothetical protein
MPPNAGSGLDRLGAAPRATIPGENSFCGPGKPLPFPAGEFTLLTTHRNAYYASLPRLCFVDISRKLPMAQNYVYRPLSAGRTTRVLDLQPDGNLHSSLRCTLKEISLDALSEPPTDEDSRTSSSRRKGQISHETLQMPDQNRYKALSYVWGAKTGTQPLLCDDKVIFITPNCEKALRHLRHATKLITLWVDAVCINQNDLAERAQQVPIMAEIYRYAQEVVIWLGEGNKRTARCFSRMKIVNLPEKLWSLRHNLPSPFCRMLFRFLSMCISLFQFRI